MLCHGIGKAVNSVQAVTVASVEELNHFLSLCLRLRLQNVLDPILIKNHHCRDIGPELYVGFSYRESRLKGTVES